PCRRHLSARLAGATPAEGPSPYPLHHKGRGQGDEALARRPALRLFGRAGGRLFSTGVADRAIRHAAAASAHAPAFAAHDGRAAAPLARRAVVPVAEGPSAAGTHLLGRATISLARAPSVLRAADSPDGGAAALCRDHLAMARAASL